MQKFIVMFLAPSATIAEWMKKPEAERKDADQQMRKEWGEWMAAHASMIKETQAAGKTKRVTKGSVADVANDLMLYSIIEAESPEAAAEVYKDHPHFGIPGATIEVLPIRPM